MDARQPKQPRKAKLSADELSILCEQIALIVGSNRLRLQDGVEALRDTYGGSRLAERFEALNATVASTGSLYEGLTAAGVFPRYMREMARIGEQTGELQAVMEGLSLYYRREAKIRRAMVNAVAYPLILIAMMATLIVILIGAVLPVFDGVFRSMGIDATANPWLAVGVGIGRVVLVAVAVLIVLALAALLAIRLDGSGRMRDRVMRLFAPLRRADEKVNAGRFASMMAMMLQSGHNMDESLRLVAGVLSNPRMAAAVEACRASIEGGTPFAQAVEEMGIFEPLHNRMIAVGSQAGQTDAVMRRLAEIYEDEADDAITRTVSLIEPTLVALMSVIIGAILLAVMLPLLSLMGGMA